MTHYAFAAPSSIVAKRHSGKKRLIQVMYAVDRTNDRSGLVIQYFRYLDYAFSSAFLPND